MIKELENLIKKIINPAHTVIFISQEDFIKIKSDLRNIFGNSPWEIINGNHIYCYGVQICCCYDLSLKQGDITIMKEQILQDQFSKETLLLQKGA